MNDHFFKNNEDTSRTSLPSVDHESLIQTNLTKHKNAFFFVNKDTSNEESPSIAAMDDVPTHEESTDEDTQCQKCYWDIHKARQLVVLHPCNCIFHFDCIKDKFYEDPKCPKCNTDTMKLRRMTVLEGRFVDKPLELEYVKIRIKNRRIDHQMHQYSSQEGDSKRVLYSRRDLVALRRKVYEKKLYCLSVRSGQALDSTEICKQILKRDPDAKGLMRAWIKLEIQALKQMTIVPDHRDSFEYAVIATLQMESNTEEQKKKKEYAVHIIRNTLDDYTDLFLHSARAFLTSFCQTLDIWNRTVTYPERNSCNSNPVTSPSARPPRPGLERSSVLSSAYMRWNPEDLRSSNAAQSIGTASPTTVAQPIAHSVDQNVPQATIPSSVAHLGHVSRPVTLSSTPASLKSSPVLGDYDTRCTVTECPDNLYFSPNKIGRRLLSRMRSWGTRAKISRSQLDSVRLDEANFQGILAEMEQPTVTLKVADNAEDGQTLGIEDTSRTEVGRGGKLSRKLKKITKFVRTFIKKPSIKKSPKGLDWEEEQDIR
ncbi:hypothetical protein BTUL_0104g00010 [Botrytis tulipae]|uniref:RING-type domain-containing protein n=1 Tax=Botrytis tulipae TaxID=87230 RepID=A0A4Z1EH63_9HELO|nr:hypothetical protein BTUL_0104g00010 [Botrytis tulipae]